MASSRDRQRQLARAKLDRQLARRAGQLRRRRRIQAGTGAGLALVLIIAGALWLGGSLDDKPTDPQAADVCLWTPRDAQGDTNLKDVGTPATTGIATSGTRLMTITTNKGAPVTVTLDLVAAPCGAASLTHLAARKFYDNTDCHEITAEGALRCGDPTGTGLGGPTYSIFSENLPAPPDPAPSASTSPRHQAPLYPKGTVALVGNPPGTNGSQFLIFLKDASPKDPQYSIVGTVTGGQDTLTAISKVPTVDNAAGDKVKPKEKLVLRSVTVGEVDPGTASAAPGTASVPSATRQP